MKYSLQRPVATRLRSIVDSTVDATGKHPILRMTESSLETSQETVRFFSGSAV